MRYAWAGLCAVLAAGSVAAWLAGNPEVWWWQAAEVAQRPWTLWSAALVHLSNAHGLGNLLALAALGLLGTALGAGIPSTLALALAWPLATAGLLFWPTVLRYAGLSATVHAGVAVLMVHCATARPPRRGWAGVLAAGLTLKLLGERAWQQPLVFDPLWGFQVVSAAHLSGTLAGSVCALLLTAAARLRVRGP